MIPRRLDRYIIIGGDWCHVCFAARMRTPIAGQVSPVMVLRRNKNSK